MACGSNASFRIETEWVLRRKKVVPRISSVWLTSRWSSSYWITSDQSEQVISSFTWKHCRILLHSFSLRNGHRTQDLFLCIFQWWWLWKKTTRVWNYLSQNLVVRKSQVLFTAIVCDHALEQENRQLKGVGGLEGITRLPSTRTKWFQILDEIRRSVCLVPDHRKTRHYQDTPHSMSVNHSMTKKVVDFLCICDPFTRDFDFLTTILSHKVAPTDVTAALLKASENGKAALQKYANERIESWSRSPWDVLHRQRLKTFKDLSKKCVITVNGKKMNISNSADFTSCLLLAEQTDANLDLNTIMTNYELSM